jgi:uncharacterized membrane protein
MIGDVQSPWKQNAREDYMNANWERYLERWTQAGLIPDFAAERIRLYEIDQEKARGLNWPILIAIAFGGLLLAAGILLFVAAHWDKLSPAQRFALILTLVAGLHLAGAVAATRFAILATALHAVGTICLGAGIFLAGQIFHLQEHWPGGVMLWALGAWVAWAMLRDWPQAAIAAIVTPVWLAGEWFEATRGWVGRDPILAVGLLMLAISYLTALPREKRTSVRKALAWIGGLALLPAVAAVILSGAPNPWRHFSWALNLQLFGWVAVYSLPLALAWLMRGKNAWINVLAALWVALLSMTSSGLRAGRGLSLSTANDLAVYALCALGSVGLIAWGMREGSRERVNIGIAGFALTVLLFYFSSVMDKLGRSASLIGLGILFLLGGWFLERIRRRLLTHMGEGAV